MTNSRGLLTVSEVLAESIGSYGVPFAAGIPGHGNWALVDALGNTPGAPRFVQVMHEQSAMHMADTCFRLTGKPGVAVASVGPGAANTLMGLATAFADSSAALVFSGAGATHMRGHGVMQTLDRKHTSDFLISAGPATKKVFDLINGDMAASTVQQAFNVMLTGRPGPAVIDVPLDIQVQATTIKPMDPSKRLPTGRIAPDQVALESALKLLLSAKRPCIVAGGGVITAQACAALQRFAELTHTPVVYTWSGKGAMSDDHSLNIGPIGVGGSKAANSTSSEADVLLAVGCRFSDWSSSSFRKGVTYSIPDTLLIHIDIDPTEIGRSYPVEVGIVGDAKVSLEALSDGVPVKRAQTLVRERDSYIDGLQRRKKDWRESLHRRVASESVPATMLSVLAEARRVLPRETIITVGSGHCQASVRQAFDIYQPRTHITSGGYSSMGFAVPAAMAAKIVNPDVPAVAIVGDGDFMMSIHEMATCMMQNLPVIFLVLNNAGFISIRDGQDAIFGRNTGAEFVMSKSDSKTSYSPDFVAMARSFGMSVATRVESWKDLGHALKTALSSNEPALIEVPITRDAARSGAEPAGWWDFPHAPNAIDQVKDDYAAGRSAQQHLGADTTDIVLQEPLGIYG